MPAPLIIAAAGRALMAKLIKSGLTRKDAAGLVEQATGSKFVRDALTKSAKTPKKMQGGGEVRASRKSARKSIDGCAVRGKTRAARKV